MRSKKKRSSLVIFLHRYRMSSGLVAILVLLGLFGNALAVQTNSNTQIELNEQTLSSIDTRYLLRDIQFEAQQSRRDIQRIDEDFRKTLALVKSTSFTCAALTDVINERAVFESLVKSSATLTENASRAQILEAYRYYAQIRGTNQVLGVRGKTYGGEKNPQTQSPVAGTLNELQTCRSIALVLNKTCAVYYATINEMKSAPQQSAELYEKTAAALKERCMNPNEVLKKEKLTLTDITNTSSAEKIFGSTTLIKKLKRIYRKVELQTQFGTKSLFTMVESLLE